MNGLLSGSSCLAGLLRLRSRDRSSAMISEILRSCSLIEMMLVGSSIHYSRRTAAANIVVDLNRRNGGGCLRDETCEPRRGYVPQPRVAVLGYPGLMEPY